jgi:hypothetical protein
MGRIRDTILGALQLAWQDAVREGRILPEEVPKPLSLDVWPPELEHVAKKLAEQQAGVGEKAGDEGGEAASIKSDGQKAGFVSGRAVSHSGAYRKVARPDDDRYPDIGPLSWIECADELRAEISRVSNNALIASGGTGERLVAFIESLGEDIERVSEVVFRGLSEDLLDQLVEMGLLQEGFRSKLDRHLERLREFGDRHSVRVIIQHWPSMPPLHGIMYAGVLCWGFWQYLNGSFRSNMGPAFRLIARDEHFDTYREVFTYGKSGPANIPVPFWDPGDRVSWWHEYEFY